MKKVILLFVFAIFSTSMLTAQSKEIQQDTDGQRTQVVETTKDSNNVLSMDNSNIDTIATDEDIVARKLAEENSKKAKSSVSNKKNDDLKKRREIAREKALQNYVAPTAEELAEKKAKQNNKQ